MTEEEFNTYKIDLEDAGFRVWCGDIGIHKWDFDFSVANMVRSRNFSLNDYSNILEDLEILCDRLEEEYDIASMSIESKFSFRTTFHKYQLLDGRLPTSDDVLEAFKKDIGKALKNSAPSMNIDKMVDNEEKSIHSINFHFDNKAYRQKQSDNGIKRLYNSMKGYDKTTAKKMRDLFPDLLKESRIKKFNQY